MAAPSFVNASTGATDATGAWTATCHAPGAAGRIIILQVLQDGSAADATLTSITNAEDLAGTDNTLTKIGEFAAGSMSQHVWIGRSLSTSAPVATGANAGGDDLYWRYYEFRDVSTGTTLATVIENVTAGSTTQEGSLSATASDASVTTLGPDRLALNFLAINDDNSLGTMSGQTGGFWAELGAYADSAGTDGAIAAFGGFAGIGTGVLEALRNVGESSANERLAQSFASGAGGTVSGVGLYMLKQGTPTDDFTVEIQTDSGGVPSGTVVGSAGTLSGADIESGVVKPRMVPVAASLSAGTTYWVVIRRSGAVDASNYYRIYSTTSSSYADGTAATYSGTWATEAYDQNFCVTFSTGGVLDGGTISITASDTWSMVGFALIGTTAAGPSLPANNYRRRTSKQAVKRASTW